MELKEAIERLLETRDRHAKNVKALEESKVYVKNTAFEDVLIERRKDVEAIDTVLAELDRLQQENEEIEPDHAPDVGKMATEKIEELDEKEFAQCDATGKCYRLLNKLNEVINKVNAQTTVLLAHDKAIKEIKEQLDY